MNPDPNLVSLSGLEVFFIALAIISLVINILQWRERRSLVMPLSNTLRSMFNDIKSKENNTYFVYSTLFNTNNPHTSMETLKWEYGLFVQAVQAYLLGFKETLVGVLVSLDPGDKTGATVVRAMDYGLTEAEKEQRDDYAKKLREQALESMATLPPKPDVPDPEGTMPTKPSWGDRIDSPQ